MKHLIIKVVVVLFMSTAMGTTTYSQLNLKVGYIGTVVNVDEVNGLFDRYNTTFENSRGLSAPTYINGLEFGVRYMFWDALGIDVTVSSGRGDTEALGVMETPDMAVDSRWKMGLLHYSVGVENHFGSLGFGASIGQQRLKYSNRKSPAADDEDIMNQSALASRFYLILEFPSDDIAVSLRPYISMNWGSYDVGPIQSQLFPGDAVPSEGVSSDPLIFGFSLLFYNGRQ